MDLDAAASDVARFLYHISFPASTRLVINCEPVNLEQEPKSLALAISARLKNPCTSGPSRTVTPFQSVALFMQEFHIFRKFLLYAWRSVLSSSDLSDTERNEEPAIQPDLQVIFQASIDDSRHNDRSVAGFCQYLPMPDAQVVYVGSTRLKDPKDSASKAFRSMDRVHTLEITEAAAKAMPSLLQSDPTFFPVLTNLRLSTVRMTGPDATPAHFVETLKARRDKGLGIKHLTITDCVVKSADVDSFREVVEEVVWDELETPDDGLEDNFEEEEEEAIEEDE
ncbi:hypothetical protein EUX98_g7013 [Antrodiella citrinella]|uniref:Uncharacterized protein n=1 Tax=Antrodiella citrinella TaxID=2447956 RepID=A0A4S4MML9_9APHY|nr:hypothetical protein EUX98_g7013 [Antrodiella citrinella]